MYRSSTIEEDLILKQVIADRFSLATSNRGFSWREVLPTEKRSPIAEIIVTRGTADSHFSLEDVADAIGDSLADLLISRREDEKSIFCDVNRKFVSDVSHSVGSFLTDFVKNDGRLRLSECDLYLLIEKALLENEAYDVAKSLAFRRSIESPNAISVPSDKKSLTTDVRENSSITAARSRKREKRPTRPLRTAEPHNTWYKNTDIGFLVILEYDLDDIQLDDCNDSDL